MTRASLRVIGTWWNIIAVLVILSSCASAATRATAHATMTATATTVPTPTATPVPPSIKEFLSPQGVANLIVGTGDRVWYAHGSTLDSISANGKPGPRITVSGSIINVVAGVDHLPWLLVHGASGFSLVHVTANNVAQAYSNPSGEEIDPRWMIVGPDGNLWYVTTTILFIDAKGQGHISAFVTRVTPAGQMQQFPYPEANVITDFWPYYFVVNTSMVVGMDHRIWFTMSHETCVSHPAIVDCNSDTPRLVAVSMTGVITSYPLPDPSVSVLAIKAGPDGNIWLSVASKSSATILVVTPSGKARSFGLPSISSTAVDLAFAPDGSLWFDENGHAIGHMVEGGDVFEYSLPTHTVSGQLPQDSLQGNTILLGPDGAFWFTERPTNFIGRIDQTGQITEISLPDEKGLSFAVEGNLIAGPSDTLWYAREIYSTQLYYPNAGAVGMITP